MSKNGVCKYMGSVPENKKKERKSGRKPVILCDITAVVEEMYQESLRLAAENAVLSERLAQANMRDASFEVCAEEKEGADHE